MKTYKIYASPLGINEAVKQGWLARFFFSLIWALVKKMWLLGVTLFVIFIFLGIIGGVLEASSGKEAATGMNVFTNILSLIISVVFGVNGNKWREKYLLSRGFEYKDTVTAEIPEAGLAQWMKERAST